MNENIPQYRQTIPSNTFSDDSCSLPSYPWFPENLKRRKSRLGTHRKPVGVLQELCNKANFVTSKEEIVSEPALKKTRSNIISSEKKPEIEKRPLKSALRTPIRSTPLPPLKSALRTPLKSTPLPNSSSTPVSSSEKQITPAVKNPNNCDEKLSTPIAKTPATPKREVRFAEPLAVVDKFVVPQSSPRIPVEINVKKHSFRVLNVLGTGGSSVVYLVAHPETNELLAVKKVKLSHADEDIAQGYLNEVQMLESLQNCDVIIKIFDHELVYEDEGKILYVVMEKGDTDLAALIRSVNATKKLSIPMIVYYWSEMLSAVNEVHSKGIIHSDLKPANFLLVRGRLKLIDFGIASSIQGDMTSVYKDVFCGTLNYMSPEAINCVQCPSGGAGYKITYKADVWSLGCILYNLIYGRLPFQHIKKKWEKLSAIVSPTINVEFPLKNDIPAILMDSLKLCLEKNPKNRPTLQELLDRTMRIFQNTR